MSAAVVGSCLNSGISDVKIRWSHLLNGGSLSSRKKPGGVPYPSEFDLVKTLIAPSPELEEHEVLIRMPSEETSLEMRTWLQENAEQKYKLFGRFEWTRYDYKVERNSLGLVVRFTDKDMAFFFKLRWYVAP